MEDELANSPLVLQLYLEAFNLEPTLQAESGSAMKPPRAVPVAREGGP